MDVYDMTAQWVGYWFVGFVVVVAVSMWYRSVKR